MPAEYERYYAGRLAPVPSAGYAAQAIASAAAARQASTAAATSTTGPPAPADAAATAAAGAAAATAWMFPWERRQLDGAPGGLKPWEKAYWGLFVGGLAFLLASRLYRGSGSEAPVESPEDVAAKVAAQAEAARALLLGKSFVGDEDEDPLEGLAPAEIQALAEKAMGSEGASGADPFDGWSPEEINAWVAANGDRVPG